MLSTLTRFSMSCVSPIKSREYIVCILWSREEENSLPFNNLKISPANKQKIYKMRRSAFAAAKYRAHNCNISQNFTRLTILTWDPNRNMHIRDLLREIQVVGKILMCTITQVQVTDVLRGRAPLNFPIPGWTAVWVNKLGNEQTANFSVTHVRFHQD